MPCLITHDDAECSKIWSSTFILLVYTSSEGSGKSSYTYAQAHLSLHCSIMRQVPKLNGLIPLFCSFVTSKSILFDLDYSKNY